MVTYFNGRFLPLEEVKISPDDRGFLFADGVYEVLCSYEGRLFRADEHFRRMERSLREIRMEGPEMDELREMAPELVRRNDLHDRNAKIYIQVTRGAAPRQHSFPDAACSPTVYASVVPYDPPEDKWENGEKVIVLPDRRWTRCDIKSVALLPNVMASQRAKEEEAYEALLVRDGFITEGSHTNVMAVFDGEIRTHPLSNHILPGITREVVLELCDELDLPVREFPVDVERLQEADELMLLGTTTGVMPVVQVEDWQVGSGRPGPITRQLQDAFRELTV